MPVERMKEDPGASLEDFNELLGEDLVTGGAPPGDAPEPVGEGQKPDAAASGSPDADPGDDRDDADGEDGKKAEQRRKRKAQERATRLARENTELRMRLRQLEEGQHALVTAELERRTGSVTAAVQAAESRLQKAIDDGDSAGQVAAQRELTQAERAAERAQALVRQVKERPAPAAQDTGEAEPELNDLANDWIERHSSWFSPTGKDKDSQLIVKISDYVERVLGISPDDPAHFAEIERRAAIELPHRFKAKAAGDRDLPATAGSSRMQAGQGDPGMPAELRDVKLTAAEVKAYEAMDAGLSWNKPEDRIQMKRYKLETMNSERNRRRG